MALLILIFFFVMQREAGLLFCCVFQAEDGIRDFHVTGVQTCALPIYGGTGALTRLLCGGFVLDDAAPAALIGLLPPVLQMNSRSADITTWLEPVFALVRQEADNNAPGAQAIFAKLADVFLSQALRTYLAGAERAGPLLPRQAADAHI